MEIFIFLALAAFCGFLAGYRHARSFYELGYDHGHGDAARIMGARVTSGEIKIERKH